MSRSLWLAVCLVGLFSFQAQAQHLHNHPQCDHYVADSVPIEPGVTCHRPTISGQLHWRVNTGSIVPDNTCALAPTDDLTCAHIHDDLTCPIYAELGLGAVVTCGFAITLHHFPGYVYEVDAGFTNQQYAVVTWDATGTTTPPAMVGDPLGDKVFTGHFTQTLPAGVQGWWFLTNAVRFQMTNGDEGFPMPLVPIWGNQQPIGEVLSYHLPIIRGGANLFGVVHPNVVWGQLTVEYQGLIPVAPITAPWTVPVAFYSYGRVDPIAGPDQIRYDMDLHHEMPGRTMFSVTQAEDLAMSWTFDPAVLGAGTHKVAVLRVQPDGGEQETSVLVINVTAGDGTVVPPPPVNCVVGPWVLVSTMTTTSPITTMGNLQSKTDSLNNLYQRTILTPPANGGAACPVN